MKNTKLSTIFAILSLVGAFQAQASDNAFVELGGNALAYSVNYEHVFDDSQVGMRMGVGGIWGDENTYIGVPLMVSKFWGAQDSNHKFETGVGATYFVQSKRYPTSFSDKLNTNNDTIVTTASLGYRYSSRDGMFFKAAFTPLFDSEFFVPMVGVSVGHSF